MGVDGQHQRPERLALDLRDAVRDVEESEHAAE